MSPKFIAATLTLALSLSSGGPCMAAGEPPAKAKTSQAPVASSENILARTVFQTLLGEFALQRNDIKLGVDAWSDLAIRTRDPKAIARATEVASFARQYDRALELAALWLEVEPDSTQARQAQSSLLVLANRLDDLAPQLVVLLEQDKANIGSNLLQLNRMLSRHADKKAVLQLIDRITPPYDSYPEAHFALAQAAAAAGENLRALNETEKTLQLRPDWEIAAIARAQLQARQSIQTAIASLDEFVGRNPNARDARLMLARLLVTDKQFAASREQFNRLIKDNPDNTDIIYPVAMLALQYGDTETGRTQLEKLLQTEFPDKNSVHFFLGQLDQEQKHPEAALAHFRQVTGGDQYIAARSRAAQILIQQDKPEEARELLRTSRGGSIAERTQLTLAEAQLLRDAGKPDEAYRVLANALAGQPDNTELLYEAALLADRNGKPQLLESHLKHLLSVKPDHAHALNALGYSYADRNIRLAEAEEMVNKALLQLPDDPFITDSLGWVLFRQGKLDDALKTLEKAYAIQADPEIAAHLGEVIWSLGRKEDAQRLLKDAARQHPDNEALTATIKKLLP